MTQGVAAGSYDTKLARAWVEALESGEFSQTTKVLRDRTGMCCLGVLCHLVDPGGWRALDIAEVEDHIEEGQIPRDAAERQPYAWGRGATKTESLMPPKDVLERVGLRGGAGREDGAFWEIAGAPAPTFDNDPDGEPDSASKQWLSNWNDQGATFPQIAAALRDYYGMPPKEGE